MQRSRAGNTIDVPYFLDHALYSFTHDIENAMREIESYSRVRFRKKGADDNKFLLIKSGDGCYFSSYDCFGRRPQTCQPTVSIGKGCRTKGTILHELLHAIGFQHEHQRHDRDKYVKIYKKNMERDDENQFDILPEKDFVWKFSDFNFDFASIMLYGEGDFSKNDNPTMVRLDGRKLTENNQLSTMDIKKLESL